MSSFLGLRAGSDSDFSTLFLFSTCSWGCRMDAMILVASCFLAQWASICCLLFLYCAIRRAISLSSLICASLRRSLRMCCLYILSQLSDELWQGSSVFVLCVCVYFLLIFQGLSSISSSTLSPKTQSSQFSPSFPSGSYSSLFSRWVAAMLSSSRLIFCSVDGWCGSLGAFPCESLSFWEWMLLSFLCQKSCAMLSVLWWSQSYLLCFITCYSEWILESDLSVERVPIVNRCRL